MSDEREDDRALIDAIAKVDLSEPKKGWEDRVRARVAERKTAPVRRLVILKITALAASIFVAVLGIALWQRSSALEVTVAQFSEGRRGTKLSPGDVVSTGGELQAGDTIRINVPRRKLVRIYRGDREVVFSRKESASFTFPSPGRYRIVLFEGTGIGAGKGSLDEDSAAVIEAGGKVELGPEINVR